MDIIVLIPSYEPEISFVDIVREIKDSFQGIVVVDDGSGEKYRDIFNQIENLGVHVLRHAVNQGKGRALKTGFHYIANTYSANVGIITADSDGQHTAKDIHNVGEALKSHPTHLVLGARDFDKDNVPFKSEFGNKMTRTVLLFFCGVKVSDTQTGLRGISLENVKLFLNVSGERFEYETNMLIESKKLNIPILDVKIETIYLEENKGTHFNPIKDSLQIYKVFGKYMLISLSSFIVDIIFFTIFLTLIKGYFDSNTILVATIMARIISSLFNYFMNCKTVFHGKNNITTMFKYYILVVIQMFVSGFCVQFLNTICPPFINVVFLKLVVDTILFALNFYIQREWIFARKEEKL